MPEGRWSAGIHAATHAGLASFDFLLCRARCKGAFGSRSENIELGQVTTRQKYRCGNREMPVTRFSLYRPKFLSEI